MRARRPGRQSDDVLGPKALAAMADAARRSREAGAGPDLGTTRPNSAPARSPGSGPEVAATSLIGPMPGSPAADTSVEPPTGPPSPPRSGPGLPDPSHLGAPTPPSPTSGGQQRPDPNGTRRDPRQRSSKLIVLVSLMAIVAALVGTWAVKGNDTRERTSASHPSSTTLSPNPAPPPVQAGTSSAAPAGPTGGAPTPSTTTLPPPTSSTTLLASGTTPKLATLEPARGAPGQILVIWGSDLLSTSGRITAHFGVETATIACPQQTSCIVMVPPDGAFVATVPVTVTTDAGTSNALTFAYT